jgi:hypothetical protein
VRGRAWIRQKTGSIVHSIRGKGRGESDRRACESREEARRSLVYARGGLARVVPRSDRVQSRTSSVRRQPLTGSCRRRGPAGFAHASSPLTAARPSCRSADPRLWKPSADRTVLCHGDRYTARPGGEGEAASAVLVTCACAPASPLATVPAVLRRVPLLQSAHRRPTPLLTVRFRSRSPAAAERDHRVISLAVLASWLLRPPRGHGALSRPPDHRSARLTSRPSGP